MYGLKEGTDLSFLGGQQLIQRCVGQNEVILNFDRDASIMIAPDAQFGRSGELRLISDARELGRAAIELVGDAVLTARGVTPGTTHLRWRSTLELAIHDSWPDYESYTIGHHDVTIVV